ncbi:hypothetical protein [Nocardia gipuzkoensis]|uniref:hypothetical protein n=1 Tax=Nocardia gipuzkoensis TaxID=2749991 RepID=UPI00237D427F|nr:hypothetical protein [Nocardia gipuzkoensis]MDE1675108.1 hypothetical protein [Nocardia gipuzkoensis]
MSFQEIPRAEYNRLRIHEYAGTIASLSDKTVQLWKETCPDWNGKHWMMGNGGAEGTWLGPVNVTD